MALTKELQRIVDAKDARLNTVPERFVGSVEANQRGIFRDIVNLLDALEVSNGEILQTSANLVRIEQIMTEFEGLVLTVLTI